MKVVDNIGDFSYDFTMVTPKKNNRSNNPGGSMDDGFPEKGIRETEIKSMASTRIRQGF
ncbi:MAG: hypothetical protein GY859_26575 [Desulfobacterales bacterium]|nr:hypothetical protein [Desulfobacterales bacterium]